MIRNAMSKGQAPPCAEAQRDRLFIGVYPTGICYADRQVEKAGDYARLAFLQFDTLHLCIEQDCPPEMKRLIEADAARIQAQQGAPFQISTAGQTVLLGRSRP